MQIFWGVVAYSDTIRAAGGPAAVVLSGNVGNHVTQFGGKREIRRGDLIFDANFENVRIRI